MILVRDEIEARQIVHSPQPDGRRSTTYDATVDQILIEGKYHLGSTFTLPARGIVWVISKEEFHLPGDVTGLATLRTRWTHNGILALNVGIIDPGWNGPLATAIVNFSKSDFQIVKGDAFLRVIFLSHRETPDKPRMESRSSYMQRMKMNTRHFSSTFLTMDTLVAEIAEKVLGLPRWGVRIALIALVASTLAIVLPVAYAMVTQTYGMPGRVDALEKLPDRVSSLEQALVELRTGREGAAVVRNKQGIPFGPKQR